MKALLLAAGLGSRLRPLTQNVPKCLVPINGKPLLQYWLELLVSGGIREILVNTHYLSDKVVDFIEKGEFKQYVKIAYEKELLGTGGTLLANLSFFDKDPIMLIHADNLSKFNIKSFIEADRNKPSGCEITMMTFETDSPSSCGILEIDQFGIVKAFHEKVQNPPGNIANGAVYILNPSIVKFLSSKNKKIIDFSNDVIPYFLGKIYTFHNDIYHRDIGNMESYNKAINEFNK